MIILNVMKDIRKVKVARGHILNNLTKYTYPDNHTFRHIFATLWKGYNYSEYTYNFWKINFKEHVSKAFKPWFLNEITQNHFSLFKTRL